MKTPANWIATIIEVTPTATVWAHLPPASEILSARPEGTKWEVSYKVGGVVSHHFTGATFTQSPAQVKNLLAL